MVGAVFVAMGLAILWFSGIGVGTAPGAAKPSPESSRALAELVTREVEKEFDRNSYVGLVVGVVAKDEEALLGFGRERLGRLAGS